MNKNRMHEILDEMGELVEDTIGKDRIFKIETVLANPLQVHNVWAGGIFECRQAALDLMRSELKPRREILKKKADIVLYGIPNWSPYAAFSVMNPMHGIMVTHPLKRLRHAGHIIVAGAEDPSLVNHVGFEPARTVEAAIDMARERHGKDASVAFVKYPLLACRE